MGYSRDDAKVRIDFFQESGKWYATDELDMHGFYEWKMLPEACIEAYRHSTNRHLRREDGTLRFSGMWAVILDPHHPNAHPQMFKVPER